MLVRVRQMWSRNESPRRDFSVRDRARRYQRWRMSRIAKGLLGPAVQKTTFAKIAKGGGLGSKGTWSRAIVDRDWRPSVWTHSHGRSSYAQPH